MQREERKQSWEDRAGEMGVEEVGEWGTEPRAATSQQGRWMTFYLWTLGLNETSRGQTMASLTPPYTHTHTAISHTHTCRHTRTTSRNIKTVADLYTRARSHKTPTHIQSHITKMQTINEHTHTLPQRLHTHIQEEIHRCSWAHTQSLPEWSRAEQQKWFWWRKQGWRNGGHFW